MQKVVSPYQVKILNTLTPYTIIDYDGIQYSVCRDFRHISQYKSLRRVVHEPNRDTRFVALETVNPFSTRLEVEYYEVGEDEVNRLDLIAYNKLGSATYAWVLAYINHIEDGYTIQGGQVLMIPKSFNKLFDKGEILAPISPTTLNLSAE